MSKKLDSEAIRQAARGQWPTILPALVGLTSEQMEIRHQPCPKCDGSDRYRAFNDFRETGGVICNKCGEFADGFATIMWMTGCTFPESLQKVADHLGIEAAKPSKKDPAKGLEFQEWNSDLVQHYLAKKPGVTEEALLTAGAKLATYHKTIPVLAFPIIGKNLNVDKPVGWVLASVLADTLPKYNREGEITDQVKTKLTYGSKPGLMGVHSIERLKTEGMPEVVWKVEGVSDMLALLAAIPELNRERHLVVTNANGASETPRWPASLLANHDTNVIHDADKPGQSGAKTWTQAIAAQSQKQIRNVQLPYDISDSKGKDLRDWLAGNTYDDLLMLADKTLPEQVARTEEGEVDFSQIEYPIQEQILKKLQIEVLYEEEGGSVRIFSTLLRKSSPIRRIDWLKKESMIQMCGATAMTYISSDPDEGGEQFTLVDVREALALAAASRRGKNDEKGIGIWQGKDDSGNETGTIVLVGDTEAARWDGDKVLHKVLSPRSDGLVLDFGANSEDWYDREQLALDLKRADDPEWCHSVIEQAYNLFDQWTWKNPEVDPMLTVGLVMATWVQTIWAWRPLVSIVGESNTGKSFLFEALGGSDHRQGIFGNLAFKQAKSSAAGIRQKLTNKAMAVLCDEFEACKERDAILKMFRASTRGDKMFLGTSGQAGKQYTMRHIPWMAAIESGLTEQPNINRFIQLELRKPKREDYGKLVLPEGQELHSLGQKLMAIAVCHVAEAKKLALRLKPTKANDIDPRIVESFAVPTAMLAMANGFDDERAATLLLDLLENVEKEEQGRTDHEDLLDAILNSRIICGGGDGALTVSQILDRPKEAYHVQNHMEKVEATGIKVTEEGDLFICHKQVGDDLLKNTKWHGQRLDQILKRISGAKLKQLRMGGRKPYGILIPACQAGFDKQTAPEAAEQPAAAA